MAAVGLKGFVARYTVGVYGYIAIFPGYGAQHGGELHVLELFRVVFFLLEVEESEGDVYKAHTGEVGGGNVLGAGQCFELVEEVVSLAQYHHISGGNLGVFFHIVLRG